MIQKMLMSSGGGGNVEPLTMLLRSYSDYLQCYTQQSSIKKYRYAKLLTESEHPSGGIITDTSVTLILNHGGTGEVTLTLTTTPIDLSNYTLDNNLNVFFGLQGVSNTWHGFCIEFYN